VPAATPKRDFWLCGDIGRRYPRLEVGDDSEDEKTGGGPLGPPPGNFFRLYRCYHLPPVPQPALAPVSQVYGFTNCPAVFVIVKWLPDFEVPTTW
jgi:hypothetical protein